MDPEPRSLGAVHLHLLSSQIKRRRLMARIVSTARAWVARRLGIKAPEARSGVWWEIDLVIVILTGAGLIGLARLFGY